jgi:hypothetical protein
MKHYIFAVYDFKGKWSQKRVSQGAMPFDTNMNRWLVKQNLIIPPKVMISEYLWNAFCAFFQIASVIGSLLTIILSDLGEA